MKFSELWLREWVNPALNSEQLAEQITMAGLEVEAIRPVAAEFSGVVIGEVVQCQQHPNADKLRVSKVNIGCEHLLNIVCGAANCRQGIKVAVATVGAVLPGDFKIKPAKLRGEPSEGMLCSYSELGIAIEADGIIELPDDAPLGVNLRQYLQLDDKMIEISVTPNRADCLSVMGVARDVALLNQLELNSQLITPVVATHQQQVTVTVQDSKACPRYLTRLITDVDASRPSPLWLQEKLRRCGIRSVDAIVDVTNFVLMELGQPMHAFDADRIDGGLVVRQAKAGESLTLLDGNEIHLTEDSLIIASAQQPLALAGIFGGQNSGVSGETRNVVLESAFFAPLAITGRARRYGLHTESSHRFERGVDYQLPYQAIERASALLIDICGGNAGPVVDNSSDDDLPHSSTIILRRQKLDRLLGHPVSDAQVTAILLGLGCQVENHHQQWHVSAPTWRFDLAIEEDLIEEVARVYGYNAIPDVPVRANLTMTTHQEASLSLLRVRNFLADKGYQEAITYSFVDPKLQQLLHPSQASLSLPNPISVDMSVMRLSLWSGLLEAVRYNQNRQQNRVRLFESGLRFVPDDNAEFGVRQEMMLSAVISGTRYQEHWNLERNAIDFYDLKGDLEELVALTGKQQQLEFRKTQNSALHPGQSAAIWLQDQYVGQIGVLHPEIESKLGLNGRTVLFELIWDSISECLLPEAQPISRFPANRRDIAVVVAENISSADIMAECKKVGGNQLVGINLFDVYCGKGVNEGYKSLAISLILQDNSRTLEEEDIAATVSTCVAALQERYQATLRD